MHVYLDNCCYNRPHDDQSQVRMTPPATLEIMDRGIRCLVDSMGAADTERFISVLLRERFDYTRWRRHFDDVPADDWNRAAAKHARVHPFRPKKPQRPLPVLSCSPASPCGWQKKGPVPFPPTGNGTGNLLSKDIP